MSTYSYDEITAEVLQILKDQGAAFNRQDLFKVEIPLSARLDEDLKFDSLDLVEIVMELEDYFKLSIPDEAVQHFNCVKDLVEYVDKQGVAVPTTSSGEDNLALVSQIEQHLWKHFDALPAETFTPKIKRVYRHLRGRGAEIAFESGKNIILEISLKQN